MTDLIAPSAGAVRTRFAPSPTGTLHLGNIRTALFAWAFARHHHGQFVLRIEDTDLERSSGASADGILRDLAWLGLDVDEGPYYQMQRMARYREVVAKLLAEGRAYHCYMSVEELDQLREAQRARGDKPRYDGHWRPENVAAHGLVPPPGRLPVIRFRNPDEGSVVWHDAVKGRIEITNGELDDLVIARQAPVGEVGVPTYNFCVVVDDIDMRISHVIRGDGHVMNTPRQINIFRALGQEPPVFGHLPTVLGNDGEKLSKRHGATGLDEYAAAGYVPEAIINGLARLGWAHGNDEIFTPAQLVEWFGLDALTPSPARFDAEKFEWLNGEHIKRHRQTRHDDPLAPRERMRDARDSLRSRSEDRRRPLSNEVDDAALMVTVVVGHQNGTQGEPLRLQAQIDGIGIAWIDNHRVAVIVVQQPDVVVLECRNKSDFEHVGTIQ